jgi:uncharacterized protein YpmB
MGTLLLIGGLVIFVAVTMAAFIVVRAERQQYAPGFYQTLDRIGQQKAQLERD